MEKISVFIFNSIVSEVVKYQYMQFNKNPAVL